MDQDNHPSRWEQKMLEKTVLATVKEQQRSRRWGIFFKSLFFGYVFFMTFVYFSPPSTQKIMQKEHTALVNINGAIGEGEEANADAIVTSIRKAAQETNVKAIILRINSPGGSPVQAGYIYDEIVRQKRIDPDKKIYAVISDIGASAAYFIASGADQVYANSASIVGSIGVLLPNFGFADLMKTLGVEQRSLIAGDNKMFLDPFSPKNEKHIEFAQKLINNVHEQFIAAVRGGRGDRLKENGDLFSGYAWTGEQALELGLIDGIGSTGFVAREIVGVEDIVDYSVPTNLLDKIASKISTHFSQPFSTWSKKWVLS